MGQHRSKSDITDALDTLDGGVELVVNNNPAFVILLDADCLEVQPISVRTSTNSNKHNIGLKLEGRKLE